MHRINIRFCSQLIFIPFQFNSEEFEGPFLPVPFQKKYFYQRILFLFLIGKKTNLSLILLVNCCRNIQGKEREELRKYYSTPVRDLWVQKKEVGFEKMTNSQLAALLLEFSLLTVSASSRKSSFALYSFLRLPRLIFVEPCLCIMW